MQEDKYKYLLGINSPADLRKLPESEVPRVCDEVREYMIDVITKTGGHFGAGLGVVELTVALHYSFDTPKDKIVFDVGHQGYPHKIITGRRDSLHTIRHKGGLSGFLKPSESPYDVFGAGHASTSISAALGIAAARDFAGEKYRVAAVIGDGSMTGGLAFEALNNAGVQNRDILVVLNDNNVSIDQNVSAISNYFNELYASSAVQTMRDRIWNLTGKFDELGDRLRRYGARLEDGVKAIVTPGGLFEAFGFKYFGPINGNNPKKLLKILKLIKDIKGPVFLHVMTQKGKGYAPAESDGHFLHAIGKIDKVTGKSLVEPPKVKIPFYQDVFGDAMLEICEKDPKVVAITAAMCEGTGLSLLANKHPERVIDVGIAEGHAVTFASGMAITGAKPVVSIYSTFLQRAYDNIIHDAAIQKLHVVFTLDRAGLVGADGPTHHGVFDLAYLRSIPGMTLVAPKNAQELKNLLYSALYYYTSGPVAIRFPRGKAYGDLEPVMSPIPLGKWEVVKQGASIAILAVGKMVREAELAAAALSSEGIEIEVVNARFIKPLDNAYLDAAFKRFDRLITVEDGQVQGGFGSAVAEYYCTSEASGAKITFMGIPDKFIDHGTQEELLAELGLDEKGIYAKVKSLLNMDIGK